MGIGQASPTPTITLSIVLSLIGICIALWALIVAIVNVRLSRFPHVRLKLHLYHGQSIDAPQPDSYMDVEVESWGLPIYDLTLYLCAKYERGEAGSSEIKVGLKRVGTCPNPMNAGQVAKFQIRAGWMKNDPMMTTRTL